MRELLEARQGRQAGVLQLRKDSQTCGVDQAFELCHHPASAIHACTVRRSAHQQFLAPHDLFSHKLNSKRHIHVLCTIFELTHRCSLNESPDHLWGLTRIRKQQIHKQNIKGTHLTKTVLQPGRHAFVLLSGKVP